MILKSLFKLLFVLISNYTAFDTFDKKVLISIVMFLSY